MRCNMIIVIVYFRRSHTARVRMRQRKRRISSSSRAGKT